LADSISGLQKREWFRGREAEMQQRLWQALCDLESSGVNIIRIEWDRVRSDPNAGAHELANVLGIQPSIEKIKSAADFIRG
jgi:LPS sulfotransferase NodH